MAMRQSRRMSLVEAIANVVVGYCLAVLTQIVVFPIFGLQVSWRQLGDRARLHRDLPDAFVRAAKTVRGDPGARRRNDDRRARSPAASPVLNLLSLVFLEQPSFEVVGCRHAVGDGLAEAQRSGLADVEEGSVRPLEGDVLAAPALDDRAAAGGDERIDQPLCGVGFGIAASVTRPAGRCARRPRPSPR